MRPALILIAVLLTACPEGNCEDAPVVEVTSADADGVNSMSLICIWTSPGTDLDSVWFDHGGEELEFEGFGDPNFDGNDSCWSIRPFATAAGSYDVTVHAMSADGCRADLVTATLSFN